MKKIVIAGICGVCMLAACAFANINNEGAAVAIGGGYLQAMH